MEPSGVLNAELFEDEGAYNEAATELVMDRSSRERLIRPIIAILCGNLIDGTARQRGLGRNARKWRHGGTPLIRGTGSTIQHGFMTSWCKHLAATFRARCVR